MRRRKGAAPGDAETQEIDTPVGPGPQATLTMRGSANDLKKQLTGGDDKDQPDKPAPENGQDDEKKKFVELLRNPKFIIRVKRTTPREFNGVKTNVEVWQAELPLAYNEIQEEIAKTAQGGKYRVAIVDPASSSTVAADTFEVDGDPFVPEHDMTQEEADRVFMRGGPKSSAEVTVEGLDRRAAVTAKMLEVEALEAQLEDSRKRREGLGKTAPQDNTRVDELERRLTEAKHQAEIEARDRKHAEEMRELKAMIAQNTQMKPVGAADPMMILLEQMREDRKQAQVQFTAILTQMKDDKMNAVLDEVKGLKNRPQPQNNMLEMAETMLKLNKMINGVRGDDEDDEGEDDKDDDRPWWERALDKLGGKLGDKLFEKFTNMEEKGEKIDRSKFLEEMSQYADQEVAEALKKQQNRLPAPPPAPNPATIPPGNPPVVVIPPAPVASLPPPPPPKGAGVPPPVEPTQIKLTVEQEIVIRVGGVLEMIEREMELQPNEYHWSYEGCWNNLPRGVLEKVCAAPDPVAMLDAFAIPLISPEKLGEMKAKIVGSPGITAWLKIGHSELKLWWAEKLKDPHFDPYADEESEEEDA